MVWFPGASLNYAENLLFRRDDGVACTTICECQPTVSTDYSYKQLRSMVQAVASAMKANGLVAGDRVAAVITNSIEAVVLFLAAASIGAIYTSTAPDMGVKGILDRYEQVEPKLIFLETEVFYAGKVIALNEKCTEVISSLARRGLKSAISLPSRMTGGDIALGNLPVNVKVTSYSAFSTAGESRELTFEQLPFHHPLIILYSSGTTGKPKCIVHSAGGILLQIKKELAYAYSVGPSGTFFQYTTTGWMMWTLLMGTLSLGARVLLYDGSPFHPDIRTFVKMISDQGATVAGLSPRFLSEMRGQGVRPRDIATFEALHTLAVGGSILTPQIHKWAQAEFGPSTRVFIGMGGTDICAAFLFSVPSLPTHAGELSCKSLGIKVEVFDEAGHNIEGTGRPGEMVVTKGHPTVPLYLWGDENFGRRISIRILVCPVVFLVLLEEVLIYPKECGGKATLWLSTPKPEAHKSLDAGERSVAISNNMHGLMTHGFTFSDGVLNPKGIRFGSGEIYSILEQLPGVAERIEDSICVGQRRPQDTDERVVLFVKMRSGFSLNRTLTVQIKSAIREKLSARHVPNYIVEVESIPYTTNGKKIELAVKKIISGAQVQPTAAVANPESLQGYYKYYREEVMIASQAKL
ncbi:hypothetical protein V5O48_001664 [Marasmius crinis-equi]|uniref:AMP-dependent synthetase/ligase domain-containing protein n=1 Tax=Marasmius crinis-equi TaxID=585013 RepID=A0ABR3FXQ1_9AGAR